MEYVYRPVLALAHVVFKGQGLKFDIRGAENIPRTGGAVLAINHTGYMDFTYAGYAALPAKRLVRFMAKESIFGHNIAGPLMRGMKHIPVDRNSGATSFRAAVNALKAGEIVGVFPEATISLSFELKEFKSGTVRMAQAAGVPILPMTIWGSQRVWTKNIPKRLGRTGTPILVTIGEPIEAPRKGDAEAINTHLHEVMVAQLHDQQSRYPALTGEDLQFLPARLGGTAPTPQEAAAREAHSMKRTKDEFTG